MDPAHSNGKPAVSSTTINIDVRFAPISTDQIQIKKRSVKKSPTLSQTPFTDLMLHPDKLEAVLKNYQRKNGIGTTPRRAGRNAGKPGPTRSWIQK